MPNRKMPPILTIRWNLMSEHKATPRNTAYTGTGLRLLDQKGRQIARWWSVTLEITSRLGHALEQEIGQRQENITFRPAAKLSFDDLMQKASQYIAEHFSDEDVSRMTDVNVLAVVCKAQPKT